MTDEQGLQDASPMPFTGTVELAEHDGSWAATYRELETRIREALGETAVVVEHCGSTSVPGLAAKPVVDVLLLVPDPTDEAAYVPQLEAAGFPFALREPDWHEHRLFRKLEPRVNLHVFAVGSPEAERMLAFRDRLRSHPDERERYEAAKRELATRRWERVQDYADAKTEVVEGIIERALAERG